MTDPTCADRIGEHLESRMRHIAALNDLASAYSTARLAEVLEDSATREQFAELRGDDLPDGTAAHEFAERDLDEIRERAEQALYELPLGLDTVTVTRIELSTGGPADYLEVFWRLAGESEPADVERIVYHFADWFDHAERELDGVEYDQAERFARTLIPELSE